MGSILEAIVSGLILVFIIYCYAFDRNERKHYLKWLLSSVIFSKLGLTIENLVRKIGLQKLPEGEQNSLDRYGWLSNNLSIATQQLTYDFIFLIVMIILGFCVNKYYESKQDSE